jgi:hypothetical protein
MLGNMLLELLVYLKYVLLPFPPLARIDDLRLLLTLIGDFSPLA